MTDSEVRWSPLCWLGGMGMQVVVSLRQKGGEGDFIHSKTHIDICMMFHLIKENSG